MLEQLDFFLPIVGEARPKDQQDLMSYPCFSLSKRKRITPIRFSSQDKFVEIRPDPKYGMATIWDADILLYFASYIRHNQPEIMRNVQEKGWSYPSTFEVSGYDMLKFTGRPVSKLGYDRLRSALSRLRGTAVTTNIRQGNITQHHEFSWISEWREYTETVTRKGKQVQQSLGFTVQLPQWFVEGVLEDTLVLSINPSYFQLTGGYQRWLYRFVRKHCGHQDGWKITLKRLHERSGALNDYKEFKKQIKRVVERGVPDYHLALVQEGKTTWLHVSQRYQLFQGDYVTVLASSPM